MCDGSSTAVVAHSLSSQYYDAVMAPSKPTGNPIADAMTAQVEREARQARLQASSRHRHLFEPSNTPEGYWDLGFDEEVKDARR